MYSAVFTGFRRRGVNLDRVQKALHYEEDKIVVRKEERFAETALTKAFDRTSK